MPSPASSSAKAPQRNFQKALKQLREIQAERKHEPESVPKPL
jgi:hypothetical protein